VNFDLHRNDGETDITASYMRRILSRLPKYKNYKVAADNLFNSKAACSKFTKEFGVHVYGTVRANMGVPNEMKAEDKKGAKDTGRLLKNKGDWFFQIDPDDNTTAYAWLDSGITHFISDFHGTKESAVHRRVSGKSGRQSVKCPQVAADYNKDMTAIDDFDRLVALHGLRLRSQKWWHAVFWWLLDVCIINALHMWRIDDALNRKDEAAKISRKQWYADLGKELLAWAAKLEEREEEMQLLQCHRKRRNGRPVPLRKVHCQIR